MTKQKQAHSPSSRFVQHFSCQLSSQTGTGWPFIGRAGLAVPGEEMAVPEIVSSLGEENSKHVWVYDAY